MRLIHRLVNEEYRRLQKQAIESAEKRKKQLIKEIPELKSAFFDLSRIGIDYSKQILKGEISAEEAEKITQLAFQKNETKIKELLKEHSYPEDYLNVQYNCGKCQDTGFIERSGDRCSCYTDIVKRVIEKEPDYKIFGIQNFTKFNPELFSNEPNPELYGTKKSPREHIMAIREKCHEFINGIHKPETKNMLFTGGTGLGKTFMANCVVYEVLLKGYSAYVTTAPMLFEITQSYLLNKDIDSEDYTAIKQCNLLVVDDMGTEKLTESRYAQLLSILEIRKNNDLSFPCKMILVTNSGIKDLYTMYTERIASRIAGDFLAYRFIGNDIRMIK
ncbi:MAG: ATP-binding protein [Clostridia bacterium]|jgi:DNA replication protein DnaC|nr:ATP-binding protein [Clostridiaceae bacterium]